MAIIFHEGMSGSGKSYEAVVTQIIPALQAGRAVDVYIEGINHERIAECAELPLERVQDLLKAFTREQVDVIHKSARDNALLVIDEAQNFWPTGRQKLSPELTQFITEHRHRGIDILLMGQVFGDVHKLWRGRITQKNFYLKQDMVGREKHYTCTVYKATMPEKFEKITTRLSNTYDPKYFGTYASVVDDSISTANFKDKRATLLGSTFVRLGLPAAGVALIFGVYGTWNFFHQKPAELKVASAPPSASTALAPPPAGARGSKTFVDDLNARYRARLGMLWIHGGQQLGLVEWWDGDQIRERLTFAEIAMLGTTVEVRGNLVKVGATWATPWRPIRGSLDVSAVGTAPGAALASALPR